MLYSDHSLATRSCYVRQLEQVIVKVRIQLYKANTCAFGNI